MPPSPSNPSSPPPAATAAELVRRRLGDGRRGLVFEGRTWSWQDVVDEACARAVLLAERRRPGPFHVGVLLENTPEYLFTLTGAALAGAVVVGLNTTRRGAELTHDIVKTDCQLLVTDSTQADRLDGLDLGPLADRIVVTDARGHGEAVLHALGAGPPDAEPSADDLYLLIFTSGSSGRPKAVRMTQGRAAVAAARVPFSPDDVLYSAMPLFHGNALAAAVFPALACGSTLVLRRRFSASAFLDDVRSSEATFCNTVGRAIAHIVATPPTEHDRDHHLKYVLAPETSEPDKAAFSARFGVPLFEGYGSSENAIILMPAPATPGSLGTARRTDDVVVIDPDTERECPRARFDADGRLLNPGEAIGELVGRNTLRNFEGYYNDPDANAARARNGWYWSGDLCYRDEDGVFFFAGRGGDWLRVDSENFAAAPVERILNRYPPAAGVVVYPVPDSRTGDQVMAAVELAAGESFDPAHFAAFLAAQPDLGTKWAPRYVRVVDALPLTATAKPDKKPLRAQRWHTPDPIWHRLGRDATYRPLTEDDVDVLRAEFEANGRANVLLAGGATPP